MKAYKGFTQALQCRGFQFESGKEYIAERVKCCEAGFHACEHPLDVFQYYSPADSRFCEVELGGELDQESQDDTKVAATRIRIGAELSLHSMIDAAIKFTFDRATLSKKTMPKKTEVLPQRQAPAVLPQRQATKVLPQRQGLNLSLVL